jgi:hypothetical protein
VNELAEGMYHIDFGSPIGICDKIKQHGIEIVTHGSGLDMRFQGLYLPAKIINIFGRTIKLPLIAPLHSEEGGLSSDILSKLFYVSDKNILAQLLNREFFKGWEEYVSQSIINILREARNSCANPYNMWDYFDFNTASKQYTFIFDLEIRNYIEERAISFDNNLQDTYLQLPADLRFNAKLYRKVLKNLDPKLALIPNANTGLRPDASPFSEFSVRIGQIILGKLRLASMVPDPTYTQGSWPNIPELMRHEEKLRKLLWNTISDDDSIDPAIFNKSFLKEAFHKHMNKEIDFSKYLNLILSFGLWYKRARITRTVQ